MSDKPFQQRDQTDGHAVRLHQVADEDEEGNREQDEIVDAARHLLSENEAGQRAFDPDVNERGERQRKTDRRAARQATNEPYEHRQARARGARADRAPAVRRAGQRKRNDDGEGDVLWPAATELGKRENRHAERAGAHRIKGEFERQAGARSLPGGETPERNRVPRHRSGGHEHDQRRQRVDALAGPRPQSLHEEGDAGVLVAGKRARGAEEAQRHHETACDVVGPFDGRGQHVAIKDRERNDDEVRRQ